MKSRHPQFKFKKRGQFNIEFTGDILVKPLFPIYTISIVYRGDLIPMVRVIKPELIEEPPHFYHENETLCLYHPKNYRWTKERLIAKDIVSWAAAWIYFYEVWLQKGVWYGPEAEHSDAFGK
jgi:hypothetical protein